MVNACCQTKHGSFFWISAYLASSRSGNQWRIYKGIVGRILEPRDGDMWYEFTTTVNTYDNRMLLNMLLKMMLFYVNYYAIECTYWI